MAAKSSYSAFNKITRCEESRNSWHIWLAQILPTKRLLRKPTISNMRSATFVLVLSPAQGCKLTKLLLAVESTLTKLWVKEGIVPACCEKHMGEIVSASSILALLEPETDPLPAAQDPQTRRQVSFPARPLSKPCSCRGTAKWHQMGSCA
jgi:hypothetical protein